jgi:hypothetical protein
LQLARGADPVEITKTSGSHPIMGFDQLEAVEYRLLASLVLPDIVLNAMLSHWRRFV